METLQVCARICTIIRSRGRRGSVGPPIHPPGTKNQRPHARHHDLPDLGSLPHTRECDLHAIEASTAITVGSHLLIFLSVECLQWKVDRNEAWYAHIPICPRRDYCGICAHLLVLSRTAPPAPAGGGDAAGSLEDRRSPEGSSGSGPSFLDASCSQQCARNPGQPTSLRKAFVLGQHTRSRVDGLCRRSDGGEPMSSIQFWSGSGLVIRQCRGVVAV